MPLPIATNSGAPGVRLCFKTEIISNFTLHVSAQNQMITQFLLQVADSLPFTSVLHETLVSVSSSVVLMVVVWYCVNCVS